MKTEYKRPEKLIISAKSNLAPRKAKVFNAQTQRYDIETELGAEDPKTGNIWCEDIPVWEVDETGRSVKRHGKWIERQFIRTE